MVGYTRLMGVDEAGTLRRLTELRQEVLEPLITEHHGRVVKLMGDGLLVEFASVVEALACAVAWQNRISEQEVATEEDKRLQFRIGINLGDVIVEGDDIHGDGVNVASRLEGLAEPGGIYLSDDVYRQVRGKVEAEFEDLGELALKNVAESVRVYRVATAVAGTASAKPNPGADLAGASFQHIADTQIASDLCDTGRLALVDEGGVPGDHEQRFDAGEAGYDVFRGPSTKYSCSGSPDMLVKGRTAIEGFSGRDKGRLAGLAEAVPVTAVATR